MPRPTERPKDTYPPQVPTRRYALFEWCRNTRNAAMVLIPPPLAGHASLLAGEGYQWGEWDRPRTGERLVAWRRLLATCEVRPHFAWLLQHGYEIHAADTQIVAYVLLPLEQTLADAGQLSDAQQKYRRLRELLDPSNPKGKPDA